MNHLKLLKRWIDSKDKSMIPCSSVLISSSVDMDFPFRSKMSLPDGFIPLNTFSMDSVSGSSSMPSAVNDDVEENEGDKIMVESGFSSSSSSSSSSTSSGLFAILVALKDVVLGFW